MIKELRDKVELLKSFQREAFRVVIRVVREEENFVIWLNAEDQLYQRGIDAEGQEIRPKYAASTVARKSRRGQPTGRVTLRDEGDFHESFFVHYEDEFFMVFADDPKGVYLYDRYGADVLGLTEENKLKLAGKIREAVIDEFRKIVLK